MDKAPKIIRSWGYYRNLYLGDGFKVKELIINPKSALSMQRHQHRSETWNLISGKAHVKTDTCILYLDTPQVIPKNTWHQGLKSGKTKLLGEKACLKNNPAFT